MPLLDPPVPILADELLGPITVTIDKIIIDQPLAAGNWTGRFTNLAFTVSDASVVAPTKIRLQRVMGGVDIGPNVLNYAAAPADVISDPGRVPMAAFTDFPIT